MPRVYLVRYGLARSVARFAPDPDLPEARFGRGQMVVVRTHRGTELGEVLGEAPALFDHDAQDRRSRVAPLLRVASTDDLDHARRAESHRAAHFAACETVFRDGLWPIEVIDAEPLLDDGRTVLHYLGPHRLDASGLVAIFRDQHGLDVVLEPVGHDITDDELEQEPIPDDPGGCESCGSKGSSGCGSCGSSGTGCAVKALIGSRRPSASATANAR